MASEKTKKIKRNLFFGFFNQILIFGIGLIVPRLILTSYGSEVNGLLSTVIQIFTYVGLLEAGIGNASLNALYKPFTDADEYSVSDVFSATQKYYRKVTVIYFLCVIAVSAIYPLCISSTLSYIKIFLIIFFQGLSGALTFFFVAAYKQVLKADGKHYIESNISLAIYILTSISKILLMYFGCDVVILQAVYCAIHCMQILIFVYIMKKRYPWLKNHKNPDMTALSQRNAFLVHEISGTIFSSTDAFLLSTFCSLMLTSVYSVYNMIFVALNSLINSINGGLNYLLGQSYAKNDGSYRKIHDSYDSLYMALVFSLFTVAYILICPFVKLYTADVTDIEYIDYLLPILFVSVQLLSCGRATSARLITIAGHAKNTQIRSMIEAIINLVVSIVLVNFIGIYGVLIGTIVALLYRANDIIIYANTKILKRSPFKTYSILLVNFAVFAAFSVFELLMREKINAFCDSYWKFIILGVIFTTVSVTLYFTSAIICNKDLMDILKKRFRKSA